MEADEIEGGMGMGGMGGMGRQPGMRERTRIVSLGPEPPNFGMLRLDMVGWIYVSVFITTTIAFFVGLTILLRHRRLYFIRLKNVKLVVAALILLHLQLSFDLMLYPLNGSLPCALEFWIMMLCLPLGIALFQAQNMQLFGTFWHQQHLLFTSRRKAPVALETAKPTCTNVFVRMWRKWDTMCYLRRTYWVIGVGTGIQIIIGLIIFLISRKFHGSWGLVSTPARNAWQCRTGWEWLPSGVWQALWTYGFGPLILFKIRNIEDTHRWKLQTTLAILFSLPALPLWLFTWFLPDFYIVNWYWPPSLWFVPGLLAMEIIIIVFPIIEIYEFKKCQKKAQAAHQEAQFSKYSLVALEMALRDDIERLEDFAATKDFSGENIIFLKRVENWKDRWRFFENNSPSGVTLNMQRDLFDSAKQIFHDCISHDTSPLPLNLDERVYSRLESIFGDPKPKPKGPVSRAVIAPFADDVVSAKEAERIAEDNVFFRTMIESREDDQPPTPPRKDSIPNVKIDMRNMVGLHPAAAALLAYNKRMIPLPRGFGKTVFDDCEAEIKGMVLENTWIRYVDSLPSSAPSTSDQSEKSTFVTKKKPLSKWSMWKRRYWHRAQTLR